MLIVFFYFYLSFILFLFLSVLQKNILAILSSLTLSFILFLCAQAVDLYCLY